MRNANARFQSNFGRISSIDRDGHNLTVPHFGDRRRRNFLLTALSMRLGKGVLSYDADVAFGADVHFGTMEKHYSALQEERIAKQAAARIGRAHQLPVRRA